MTGRRTRGLVAGCVLAATTLTGCSSALGKPAAATYPTISCPVKSGGPLTLVVGARANSPRPTIPTQIEGLISAAATSEQKVQIIRLDGAPTVALQATYTASGNNDQIRARNQQHFIDEIMQYAQQELEPKAPQADVLGALTLAGQVTQAGGTVVMIDSGLPTAGPLSYQNQDMFGAAPGDVTKFLKSQNLMPDLSQLSVVFVGVGHTATPQPQLAPNLQAQLLSLWTAVASQANATCVLPLKASPGTASIATQVPVAVVQPPPPPVFHDCGTTVLSDSGSVGFIVDTSTFRDPQGARDTLEQLANTLNSKPQETVTLTGETSSEGGAQHNLDLSRERADAVKSQLVQLGIAASRITTVGAGSGGPGHIPDTVNGVQDPVKAEHNRAVVVQMVCD